MSGKAIIIAGMRGSGKSTKARELVAKVHPDARLIYDVNNEYKDLYNKPFVDFDTFTDTLDNIRNGVTLIEEATIFLSNRGNNFDVRSALVKARHNNNMFILVFHSLRSIPRYIFDLCDYVYLFKTNDTIEIVEGFDNPKLITYFNHIRASSFRINVNGKRFSPHALFSIQE